MYQPQLKNKTDRDLIYKSIIKTLSYSDIFDFPLTITELHKFYIGDKVSKKVLSTTVKEMVSKGLIGKKSGYHYLIGKNKNYSVRVRRSRESSKKLKKAKKYAGILKFIPTVRLIGISGSLSMGNCERKDDIDLFFITSKGSLWITRAVVSLALAVSGIKRNRRDSLGIDKVCPNMFVSEEELGINKNLFTAHEVSQIKVLVNKNLSYEKFLSKNKWVLKYMPNAFKRISVTDSSRENTILKLVDKAFFGIQYLYMKRRITVEKISQNRAAFHPKDKTCFVLDLYKNKYKTYEKWVFRAKATQPQKGFTLASNFTPGY